MLLAKRLAPKAELHQSVLHEFFRQPQFEEQGESEKASCITLDAHSAVAHEAPGNATYMARKATLTGGLFFALMGWLATVFVSLLRIPGLFASHIAGIIMKLALRIFAGQLLIRVLVIGHRALLSR
jgi:hypothetical protein